jgi:hypothetical protein
VLEVCFGRSNPSVRANVYIPVLFHWFVRKYNKRSVVNDHQSEGLLQFFVIVPSKFLSSYKRGLDG